MITFVMMRIFILLCLFNLFIIQTLKVQPDVKLYLDHKVTPASLSVPKSMRSTKNECFFFIFKKLSINICSLMVHPKQMFSFPLLRMGTCQNGKSRQTGMTFPVCLCRKSRIVRNVLMQYPFYKNHILWIIWISTLILLLI